MLNVYLSGEIHSNWREEIIDLCNKENLEINFTSPVTNHEAQTIVELRYLAWRIIIIGKITKVQK